MQSINYVVSKQLPSSPIINITEFERHLVIHNYTISQRVTHTPISQQITPHYNPVESQQTVDRRPEPSFPRSQYYCTCNKKDSRLYTKTRDLSTRSYRVTPLASTERSRILQEQHISDLNRVFRSQQTGCCFQGNEAHSRLEQTHSLNVLAFSGMEWDGGRKEGRKKGRKGGVVL